MVKIRLWRAGAKNQPFYRIVAIDSRTKRDGAYLDILGTYNPIKSSITLNKELIIKWLNSGAKPTTTIRNMLSKEGIYTELETKSSKVSSNNSKTKK